MAYATHSYILCRICKQKDTSEVKFIKSKGVTNKTYASEGGFDVIKGKPERYSTENDYSTVDENGGIENHINDANPTQQAKATNSVRYGFAKPQMKAKEDSKDYDHLEHLGLNQQSDESHDTNNTYAHVNAEGDDNNDTYSHAQSGQCDETYEHARNVGYDSKDTYDHSHVSVKEVINESSDYTFAHAQNSVGNEDDYDHTGFGDINENDTYE